MEEVSASAATLRKMALTRIRSIMVSGNEDWIDSDDDESLDDEGQGTRAVEDFGSMFMDSAQELKDMMVDKAKTKFTVFAVEVPTIIMILRPIIA